MVLTAAVGSVASLPRGAGGLPTAASGPFWPPAGASRRPRASPGSLAAGSAALRPPGALLRGHHTGASAASAGARMIFPAWLRRLPLTSVGL
eukprot:15450401-Alexandrium_andersonii.AAC.1